MCIYSANARWRGRRDKAVACAILSALILAGTKFRSGQRTLQILAMLLLTHKRPVDPDDALFCKALERFWKN
jgi:hypothetical protein